MTKRIIKGLMFLILLGGIGKTSDLLVWGKTPANVHYIYNQQSLAVGDELSLKINLQDYSDVYQLSLLIRYDKEFLEPINRANGYFTFSEANIFTRSETVLADLVDDTYLRFVCYKTSDITNGYCSSGFRQVTEVHFRVIQAIGDVETFFTNGSNNISFTLKNSVNQVITASPNWSSKIQWNWPIDCYQLSVFESAPVFLDDLSIETDHLYNIESNIDEFTSDRIGTFILEVQIYDYANGDIISITKGVNITDSTPPSLAIVAGTPLLASKLGEYDWLNLVSVTDNYDEDCEIKLSFYDNNMQLLNSPADFRSYLTTHLQGNIVYIAHDSSDNLSLPLSYPILLIDDIAPTIGELANVVLADYALSDYDFTKKIVVQDTYDPMPKIVLYAVDANGHKVEDYKQLLLTKLEANLYYYAIDVAGNKSVICQTTIKITDTTAPVIGADNQLIITDQVLFGYDWTKGLVVSDNYDQTPKVVWQYYNEQNECITMDAFVELLYQKSPAYLGYIVSDASNNTAPCFYQEIILRDTIAPVITVKGLINNETYIDVPTISYQVNDNFYGMISMQLFLDEVLVDDLNGPLSKLSRGEHHLRIIANDESGNYSSVNYVFFMGSEYYLFTGLDNNGYLLLIVGTMSAITIAIAIVRYYARKRQKKQLEKAQILPFDH